MDALWIGLGFVVLAVTLVDVFLSALNYDEAGFVAGRVARWQWALTRRFTRRMSRRWRPVVLRQVIGLQVMGTVITWIGGTIIGYGLIYLGSMRGKNFTYDGVHGDLFGAMYFSTAQLSTVGTSQLTPNTDFLRILSVIETLTGVVLVSLILTFLLGVYDAISNLRSLSSQFYSAGDGVSDPISSLAPYFPGGTETGLDSHLQSVSDSFSSYTDGVRLHHAAYYFQSGRDTFSLPYSIQMLAGIIGGLRWGLPASNPVTSEPTLIPLTDQFDDFATYMHPLLQWTSTDVPETVTAGEFSRQVRAELAKDRPRARRRVQRRDDGDPWVHRFVLVNRDMARLAGIEPLEDIDEAYTRYVEWLPFAYRAQQFSTAVSRDLDYQPIYANPEDEAPEAVLAPAPDEIDRNKGGGGLKGFLSRRVTLIDPGYSRLIGAIRALLSAALAVTVLVVGLPLIGASPFPAAIFGGMIAMFTGSAAGGGHGIRRLAALIAVIPVLISLGIHAVVPHDPLPQTAALAVLAFVGVAVTRFGPKFRGFGQLAFMTYYFTLILDLQGDEFLLFGGTAIVGVLSSVVLQMIPNKGAHARVVKGGVVALENRLARALDPVIDAVSAARWDPDLMRRTRNELRQTHQMASFLAGQLTGEDPDIGLTAAQASALQIRVHEAELALVNLSSEARQATGAGIPFDVRARLAGAVQSVQKRIAEYPDVPAWVSPAADADQTSDRGLPSDAAPAPDPADSLPSLQSAVHWPRAARRVLGAAYELQHAVDVLHSARAVDLASTPAWTDPSTQSVPTTETAVEPASTGETAIATTAAAGQPPVSGDTAPIWRRAIQAGVSTAVALFLGSYVSTTHQYWAAMPAYQAIGGTDGETFVKGSQRIVGTVLGAIVGFGIAIAAGPNPAVLVPVLAVSVFAMTYFRGASSPLTSFFMTMMFAQLYEFLGRLNSETIGVRIVETIIGAGIALIVAALILPTRTSDKFARQAVQLTRTVESITMTTLELWKRNRQPSTDDITALSRQESVMTSQLRDLQATAGPLRHGSGAFEPGGIENRLTGFWELLYYTRHFIGSAEQGHRVRAHLTEEQWEQLETATEQNFDALIAAYEGRASGPVHGDIGVDDLGDSDEPRAAEAALRALARANQTVAIMAVDLAPEAANLPPQRQGA
ncbi:FUSC family protein [Mycetocola zhujimingii]|uniref:FUSC family protein n=1 Tax=Mycetocola zhujimingii TaxID=2079792 RepID=UPI000D3CADB9|nr:FUSC family protein [Mycetocola zhujimingii]AWB86141.1 hypothetical protein C3E77_05615 [Mycetocola zhujimingii]